MRQIVWASYQEQSEKQLDTKELSTDSAARLLHLLDELLFLGLESHHVCKANGLIFLMAVRRKFIDQIKVSDFYIFLIIVVYRGYSSVVSTNFVKQSFQFITFSSPLTTCCQTVKKLAKWAVCIT